MARPCKPTELLKLNGTFRPDRHGRGRVCPKSPHPIGEPPEHLAPDEATAWCEFVQHAPAGVLTSGDRWLLEVTVRLVARSRRQAPTGAELGCLRACLTELGATPASRSRVLPAGAAEVLAALPWDVPLARN